MSKEVLSVFEVNEIMGKSRPKTGWAYDLCRDIEAAVISRFRAQGGTTNDNSASHLANKAEVERDAARYRWLRNPDTDVALVLDKRTGFVEPMEGVQGVGGYHTYEYRAGDELDAAVDAAMCASTPPATTGGANATPTGASMAPEEVRAFLEEMKMSGKEMNGSYWIPRAAKLLEAWPVGASTSRDQALEEAAVICDNAAKEEYPMTAAGLRDSIRALKGAPPASTAFMSTVLTDEQLICKVARENGAPIPIAVARAIASEVAAQAGQVAPAAAAELAEAIGNMCCNEFHAGSPNEEVRRAYGRGYRQARADAAELAAGAAAGQVAVPGDLAKDAARYRWLRNPDTDVALVLDKRTGFVEPMEGMQGVGGYHTYEYRAGDELDTAIDAAIAASPSPAKESK